MIIESEISYGYLDLMKTFFTANNLTVDCLLRFYDNKKLITFKYEDDSDTAYQITFMSVRHLGFENMLVDYLNRCGYPPSLISIGRAIEKRDMKKLDQDWEEHRRKLGFR
ncbi:MAG TPA: hypothetical protein VIY47_15930 [Ignavibacteriaceae bacterium]